MSYFRGLYEPVPPMVSPLTSGWSDLSIRANVNSLSSSTYESANRALYFPIIVPTVCVVRRLWCANGSSVAGNVDVGIYWDAGYKPGARLVSSGSTTQTGTYTVQFFDISDTALSPGRWWLAIASSSTLARFFMAGPNPPYAYTDAGISFMQASALPLPSTATPAETAGQKIYVFGFATTASP